MKKEITQQATLSLSERYLPINLWAERKKKIEKKNREENIQKKLYYNPEYKKIQK